MQARTSLICLFAATSMAVCVHASAEIYKWTDKDGRIHYSDKPAAQGPSERVQIRTVPAGSGGGWTAGESVATPTGGPGATSEKQPLDVVMYATKSCGYCAKARAFLTQRGIGWNEVDIESSEAAQSEFKSRGGQGVPLTFVNGKPVRGFDEVAWQSVFSGYGY